jgi:Fe(3+) dicitrate transport protein
LLEAVQWHSEGFKNLDGGGDTGFDKTELMAKGRLNTDPAKSQYHQLDLKLGYSREISNETYLGLTNSDFAASPYRRYRASALDRMQWWRTQVELRHTFEVGNDFSIETVGYRHDFSRDWFKLNGMVDNVPLQDIMLDPSSGRRRLYYDILRGEANSTSEEERLRIGNNGRDFVSQGVQTRSVWLLEGESWANELRAGLRLHHDRIVRDHTENEYRMVEGDLVEADDELTTTVNNRGSTLAFAAHIQDQLDWGRLTLAPGVRFEHIRTSFENFKNDATSSSVQNVVLPGLGAYVELIDSLGVLGGVHRGFSPVAPGQPEGTRPELAWNYEGGARYFDPEIGQLVEVVGFFTDYENLTSNCTFSAGCDVDQIDRQYNAGAVHVWGVETVAQLGIGLPGEWKIPLRLSYTYTDSRFLTSFLSDNPQFGEVEVGDELPYIPHHQGSLRLGVTDETFRSTLAATWVGSMREQASQGEEGLRTPSYVVFDVLLSYAFSETFEVYAKGENVTNARPVASRRPFGARPVRPLMVQGGVRLGF